MNLGIDIGSVKTIIHSTRDNGKIVEDEFGKKEIQTVIERTVPIRSFGNAVTSDAVANIQVRRRGFMANILNQESQENLLMFLNFIDRTIRRNSDYRDSCLTIPEFFDEEHKRILKAIVEASDLNVTTFITHTTAIAASAALRNLQIASEFMIIDCGHSKTSVGIFSFADNKLTPLRRWHIRRGAKDFDEAVFSTLIKKYDLPDSLVTREKIFKEINTIKRGLNTLEKVDLRILSEKYVLVDMQITREEYLSLLQPILGELKDFFANVKRDSKFNGYIEVVGNNSNNAYIREILGDLAYSTTLNTSESASLGACLALAVNSRKMQFKVDEILGRDIHIKIVGGNVQPSLVVAANTPLTFENVKIKYNRKSSFDLEVLENGKRIGLIKITKPETNTSETVVISVRITSFLTFEVVSVEIPNKKDESSEEISFVYNTFEMDKTPLEKMKETDKELTAADQTKKMIEKMRNNLENMLDSFDNTINKMFPNLITSDEAKEIEKVRDAFFDSQPVTKTLEEEEKVKNSVMESLKFVNEKLKTIEDSIRESGKEILKKFDTETVNKIGSGASSNKVHNTVHRLRGFLQSLKIDIEKLHLFDGSIFEKLKNDIEKESEMAIAEEEKKRKEKASKEEKTDEDADDNCNSHHCDCGNNGCGS